MTEEPVEEARGPVGGDLQGPPGGRVFSLEGRRTPSLYLIAWVLSVGGLALLFVGIGAAPGFGRAALVYLGAIALGVGLASGAGYQVVERSDRHPERYRGPSPLLVFGILLAWSSLLSGVLVGSGVLDPARPFGFLAALAVVAIGYFAIVWLFVIRTGALSWREMGWPVRASEMTRRVLRDAGASIAIMLPATFGILVLGSLLATVLGVEAPDVLPAPTSSLEAFAVALGAAIIAPFGEELFFRGFALTAWLRDIGQRAAIVRSALLFAVVHISNIGATPDTLREGVSQALLQTLVILPVGLVLGWLCIRHGMVGAIAGHVTYNTLLLVLLLVASLLSGLPEP